MWKKLYTNSGLILLAVLAAGVWTSNLLSLYQAKNVAPQGLTAEDRIRIWKEEQKEKQAQSPSPTPRKSAEEILGIAPSPTPGKYADFEQVINAPRGASAICRDG